MQGAEDHSDGFEVESAGETVAAGEDVGDCGTAVAGAGYGSAPGGVIGVEVGFSGNGLGWKWGYLLSNFGD